MVLVNEDLLWKIVNKIKTSPSEVYVFGRVNGSIIIGIGTLSGVSVISLESDNEVEPLLRIKVLETGVERLLDSVYLNLSYELDFLEEVVGDGA